VAGDRVSVEVLSTEPIGRVRGGGKKREPKNYEKTGQKTDPVVIPAPQETRAGGGGHCLQRAGELEPPDGLV